MFGSGCSAATPDGSPDEAPDATFPDANSDRTPGTTDSRDARETAEASTVDARAVDGAARPDGATIPDAAITDGRGSLDDARDAARDATSTIDTQSDVRDATADTGANRDANTNDAPPDSGNGADSGRPTDAATGDGALVPITIWIAGDSTVQTYPAGNTSGVGGRELEGWGQEIAPFFNDKVTISNQAIGGRSVAFFMWAVQRDAAGNYLCVDADGTPQFELDAQGNRIDTAQWARIKNGIKSGDFLLAQFGTNDRARACPKYVNLTDFETYFGMMADAVRAKGATPIFVTPMGHRSFTGTAVNNGLLPYANAMKHEAMLKSVQVADLNLRSVEYYAVVGDAYLAATIFDTGSTHFVKAGAIKMASLVAGEIRAQGGPLAAYLK